MENTQLSEALDQVLEAYKRYYTTNRETPTAPFDAEAVFDMHGEQYFLIKSAKLTDIDSREYAYFKTTQELTQEDLDNWDKIAWESGMAKVQPSSSHRNTDVALVIIAEHMSPEMAKAVRKKKHYQSYALGLKGWSNYRVIAIGLSDGNIAYNRQGESLKKTLRNIKSFSLKGEKSK